MRRCSSSLLTLCALVLATVLLSAVRAELLLKAGGLPMYGRYFCLTNSLTGQVNGDAGLQACDPTNDIYVWQGMSTLSCTGNNTLCTVRFYTMPTTCAVLSMN